MFIRLRFPLRFRWLIALRLFEIASVLVRLDHVARVIVGRGGVYEVLGNHR
jgi:hypothetical protein